MLKVQPFYLKPAYLREFLQYIFEKKQIAAYEKVSTETLLKKIKKVIKPFKLLPQKQQQQYLISIAEMTTQYPQQLENAFEKIKNTAETVSKQDLVQMFGRLELAEHFIQTIVGELAICSEDLDHLSIRGFFERFYIRDLGSD